MIEVLQEVNCDFESGLNAKGKGWIGNPRVDLESIRSSIDEHTLLSIDTPAAHVGEEDAEEMGEAISATRIAGDFLFDPSLVDE